MKRVYLDHNATTPLRPEARAALLETLDALGGNASSVHASGRRARQLLDEARERIAGALGVDEDELVFTSGGTESDNLAVLGAVRAAGPRAALVTSTIEHSAVLGAAAALEEQGHPVTRVAVDARGAVDPDEVVDAARGAALVSLQAANNEVGSCPDLGAVSAGLTERYGATAARVHCDAVQALGRLELDLRGSGVHLASFSAHKIGGPPGCGLLYRRAGTPLAGLWHGGGQEGALRPGTENVAGAVATAVAVELAVVERASFAQRTARLARALHDGLLRAGVRFRLAGPALDAPLRLPNTINIVLDDVDGQVLVTRLDLAGLEASAGSACASGSLEPSHVLLAMGLDARAARAGLRLSLGRTTNAEDIHTAVDIVSTTCARRRKSCVDVPTGERSVKKLPRHR